MVEGGGGTAFPVIFFDGEREIDIGTMKISPVLEFKAFQLMISQRIGISPNQISIYFCKNHKSVSEDRRRLPVTSKVNFAAIAREKDCFFLVILKRSRKARNQRKAKEFFGEYFPENEYPPPSPSPPQQENLILLRRNQSFYDQITQSELVSLNERLQTLKIQRENYAMAMAQHSDPVFNPHLSMDFDPNPDPLPAYSTMTKIPKKAFCDECENSNEFHPCANDVMLGIRAFRTRAGPIGRPTSP